MKKSVKRIGIVLIIVIFLLLSAGLFAGNYFYNLALNPKADRTAILQAPHNQIDHGNSAWEEEQKQIQEWQKKTVFQDEYIQSFDDLKLHAYVVPNETPSDKWVLLYHGYNGVSSNMFNSGMHFYEMGFNLLIPDGRGAGQSEGNYIGMGWHDRLDVVSWIDTIIAQDESAQIVLYGVSMGGATVMMTSGEELPAQVKAIVEDCGYSSVWDEFSYQMKEIFGLPEFPILHFSSLVTKIRAGYTLGEADAVKQVAKSKTPMLFIHGDQDTFVPTKMVDQVYAAANVPKDKIVVKGAGHGEAARVLGSEYWKAIADFTQPYLN